VVEAHLALPGAGGILLVQPPPPALALRAGEVDAWIRQALADAERHGVRGGRVTPFVLARVAEASGGRTLRANIGLIINNAATAAQIAVARAHHRER
jgi:pseudouridine-5'-phosphate glycosidase